MTHHEHHDTSPSDPVRVSDDPADVAKVHELISGMDIAMLTTVDADSPEGRLTSRPLSTQLAEEDGDVLFLVRASSAVAADVRADPRVNVAYSSMKAWVSLAGTATLVEDRALVKQLWSKGADMFMDGGPENPDNVVLKISGDTAHYWGGDSLIGTAVSTVKAITGRKGGDDEGGSSTVVELP
ncbi:pyridoxamine 5'-phosphate oxidase family protein [Ornithinimicrobium cerasi]|uniref:General stress protein 26 n=1 Tax=Ornithinimicrobium cerasi TaxID=2248773 RepID=A0A285VWH8_9MICO|nr:pyridoxamine 5'-phosphate oxidase family protein [Ornithinimicrobium cerasi]SOC58395.1 General stress protein 26 [Ornithinimicrobium cerasi]